MFRFFNIKKIVELLELGFHFKCIRPREGEIEIFKDEGTFHVALDRFRVFPIKKNVEEIAEIIYSSEYYVFSNSNEILPELIGDYDYILKEKDKVNSIY
jgi:hypothetical protein